MRRTSRRAALVSIAGAGALASCSSSTDGRAAALSDEQIALLREAAGRIIPASDTPGAAGAGVHLMLAEDAAGNEDLRTRLAEALGRLAADGFLDRDEAGRDALLTEYSQAADERAGYFTLLKNATIDRYYSTEIGLAGELGYQGNTYLAEFPGCQHPPGEHV